MENARKKVIKFFKSIQDNMHYTMKDILEMSSLEFETFLETLEKQKINESPEVVEMKIDEAFPQFFTDPFSKRKDKQ